MARRPWREVQGNRHMLKLAAGSFLVTLAVLVALPELLHVDVEIMMYVLFAVILLMIL